jgi:hypothetical protein
MCLRLDIFSTIRPPSQVYDIMFKADDTMGNLVDKIRRGLANAGTVDLGGRRCSGLPKFKTVEHVEEYRW